MSWKNTRVSSAPGWSPVVAPQIAIVPPGRTDLTEWPQVAAPTDSMTASTLRGRRAPDSNAASAPSSIALARLASEREVTNTSSPAAWASWIAAVDTPPPAPWTRIVSPGLTFAAVNTSE